MRSELRAGVARVGITPPIGIPMAGYGSRDRPSEGILGPLSVYAVALEQEGVGCGIVVGDVIGFPAQMTAQIRQRTGRLCGLAPEGVLVCATHTHWGPETRSENVPEALAGTVCEEYWVVLGQLATSALVQAWATREPAVALCGVGEADLLSFNRRPVGPDGRTAMRYTLPLGQALAASSEGARLAVTWAPGGGPGRRLSEPLDELDGLRAGVSDPSVAVLKLIRPDGSPLAALFCFACHAVCGAGNDAFYLYSPDYPGDARRVAEAVLGCPAIFLPGCCGDQVPLRREADSRRRIGQSLGAEVVRVWELLEGESIGPLRVGRRTVSLPSAEGGGAAEAPAKQVELWAMALGSSWGLVALPGEVLVEIGLQIRQRSPFGTTAVVELGLDDPGYVPTEAAIEEGGYEPSASPFGRGAEAALVEGGRSALDSVAR